VTTILICLTFVVLVFWAAGRFERKIRVSSKWVTRHDKIRIDDRTARDVIKGCDFILEVCDPQSNEYRDAMETKLKLERALKATS
jgi:hypothetical protein